MSAHIISIRLPLPIPVLGELGNMIDRRWPGSAVVVSEEGAPGWKIDPQHMHIRVDLDAEESDAPEVDLNSVHEDGSFGFGTPEEIAVGLVALFRGVLDSQGAENYVTFTVGGRHDDERYEVTVGRLGGKSPAERIAELEAELAATADGGEA